MNHGVITVIIFHFRLFPAHDYKGQTSTTVAEEKMFNPRLTKSIDEFIDIMSKLNLSYPKLIGNYKSNFIYSKYLINVFSITYSLQIKLFLLTKYVAFKREWNKLWKFPSNDYINGLFLIYFIESNCRVPNEKKMMS